MNTEDVSYHSPTEKEINSAEGQSSPDIVLSEVSITNLFR